MGGKVIRIPEEARETIISLRKEGMPIRKISEHMAKELGRTLSFGGIYSICKGIKKGKHGGGQNPRVITKEPGLEEDPRQIVKEIKELIEGLHATYMDTLRAIRVDLIRARARLQERAGE